MQLRGDGAEPRRGNRQPQLPCHAPLRQSGRRADAGQRAHQQRGRRTQDPAFRPAHVVTAIERDQMLEADPGHGDPEEHRQVRVLPHLESGGVELASDVTLIRGARDIEVPPAQNERECHAREGGGGGRRAPVLLTLDAVHHRRNELA
jgi:hypothetical protein